MHLSCVGVSYRSAAVELRERAALSDAQQQQVLTLAAAHELSGVHELMILSTCNRTEFYIVSDSAEVPESVLDAWLGQTQLEERVLRPALWTLHDEACTRHLFEVSAGLDSQVIGEPQILGQVAAAYERARVQHSLGATLSALMQSAIQLGKRVRTETAIGQGMVSISSVAAAHSRAIFGELTHATVLIIGTGEMARGAVASLVRQSADQLLVTNHNLEHARAFAAEWNGEVIPYTQLGLALHRADLVITAVAAPHAVLHAADLAAIQPTRGERPLVIFDIALPRNVEPEVGALPGIRLYNLDDLQAVTDAHYNIRQAALPAAELIITEELKAFLMRQSERAAVPVIQSLRGKADAIRADELKSVFKRLPDLDAHSREVIEAFSHRLVNKLLHQPTLKIKEKSAMGEADLYASILNDLFALTDQDS